MRTGWALWCVLGAAMLPLAAASQTPPPAMAAETSLADQTDVAVTAYNNGLALVRDTRKVNIPTGELELKFMDVAQQIRPETVSLKSLSAPGSIAILEQNYEFDLISPAKLMEKYVGKKVRLVNFSTEIGFQEVEAELLSNNEGPVYKVNNQIFLGHPGNVVLPEIPGNLIAKPSLIWLLNNTQAGQDVQITYLTNGVTWQADYVLTLAKDAASLDVAGWVTLNNQSGATYSNAELKLVAGAVNIAPPQEMVMAYGGAGGMPAPAMAAPMPREEAFAEYHLYTIARRTTIKQNQSKQVALLAGVGVKCEKKYEYRGEERVYSQPIPPMEKEHVGVFLKFKNKQENQLGIPLPGGVMRIYQEDQDGMLQFAGEDRIKHIPKDEEVSLKMGEAFDVIGDRVQMDFQQIANNVTESAYEITLRNHKDADIVVDVVEPLPGDWEVVQKSQDFEKKDARTIIFHVPVAKDAEVKVSYRVRVTF